MNPEERFRRDIELAERELRSAEAPPGCLLGLLEALGFGNRPAKIAVAKRRLERARSDYEQLTSSIGDRDTLQQLLTNTIELGGVLVLEATFLDISLDGKSTYPTNWEELRQQILARDSHRCQESAANCKGPLQIHHKRPLSQNGSNHPSNLITLCARHHAHKHPNNPAMNRWL